MFQNFQLNQYEPGEISLTWETLIDSAKYYVLVERSNSSEGPFELLTKIPIVNAYGFIDRTANRDAADRIFYYRLIARNKIDSNDQVSSEVIQTHYDPPNHIAKYIAKQERRLLERFIGQKFILYTRKTFGKRCPICYDPVRQKSFKDHCNNCFGTTFDGGFFAPIVIYVNTNPRIESHNKTEIITTEQRGVQAWCGATPKVTPGDLLIEKERKNQRFVVDVVSHTETRDAIVHQNLQMTLLQGSHPFYLVPEEPDARSINDVNVYRRDWVR